MIGERHDDRRGWIHDAGGHGGEEGAGPGRPVQPAVPRLVDWDEPFARLALTHLLNVGGDALVAIALANSLFFSNPSGSRSNVILYLMFTMAPFAVVGPLIGPAMDRVRGGHRLVIVGSAMARCLLTVAMAREIGGGLLLFPEAFLSLVLGKTYQVARAAVVPATVNSDSELVEANSKLQLLSGLGALALGVPGALLSIAGPEYVLGFASVVFFAGAVTALRLPAAGHADLGSMTLERAELRSASVRVASSTMGWLRAVVGFVTFLLAFTLRREPPVPPAGRSAGRAVGAVVNRGAPDFTPVPAVPTWYFGAVVAASVAGGLAGSALAPRVRAMVVETQILLGALVLSVVAGVAGALIGGVGGMVLLAFLVAVAAGVGKQAFDAMIQAVAPDADRGRSFAMFESRFQIAWVLGALVPVALTLPVPAGSAVVAVGGTAVAIAYHVGWDRVARLPRRARSPG